MERSIFRAYDVRGKYPQELSDAATRMIARSLARHYEKGTIVVGYDARVSSRKLYRIVRGELEQFGLRVVSAGLIPTPLLYFLVHRLRARGGIMITASHSPAAYNGLKAVDRNATPLSGIELRRLVARSG